MDKLTREQLIDLYKRIRKDLINTVKRDIQNKVNSSFYTDFDILESFSINAEAWLGDMGIIIEDCLSDYEHRCLTSQFEEFLEKYHEVWPEDTFWKKEEPWTETKTIELTEDTAWKIYNFVNDWKAGRFGVKSLQEAIDNNYGKE